MRVAVLDLGTNVFNLLLADFTESGCEYIKEFKCAAKLGAGGLSSGKISEAAFGTAALAMERILNEIKKAGGADRIVPYATSAVRDAKNGTEFVKFMHDRFGLDVQVIPGEREAELIFKGIMQSLSEQFPQQLEKCAEDGEKILMLDIGGGSNELIISDGERILWKRSFPIGMARMREKFQYEDPIGAEVIADFEAYCNQVLQPLYEEIDRYRPTVFVGSSGSFDTFKDLIFGLDAPKVPCMVIPADKLEQMHNVLVNSTSQQRLAMPGMSPIRVDYIVLASVFTQLVLRKINHRVIYQSDYSLKEGGMAELYKEFVGKNK